MFQFITGAEWGWDQGSVQTSQILPQQTWKSTSSWRWLCADATLSCWNRKGQNTNCCHKVENIIAWITVFIYCHNNVISLNWKWKHTYIWSYSDIFNLHLDPNLHLQMKIPIYLWTRMYVQDISFSFKCSSSSLENSINVKIKRCHLQVLDSAWDKHKNSLANP